MYKEFYESLLAILFMTGNGGKELMGGGIKDLAFCPEFALIYQKSNQPLGDKTFFSYYQNAEDFDSKEDYK